MFFEYLLLKKGIRNLQQKLILHILAHEYN